jgi:hypothetical protein
LTGQSAYRLISAVFESSGYVLHPNCVQFLSTERELPVGLDVVSLPVDDRPFRPPRGGCQPARGRGAGTWASGVRGPTCSGIRAVPAAVTLVGAEPTPPMPGLGGRHRGVGVWPVLHGEGSVAPGLRLAGANVNTVGRLKCAPEVAHGPRTARRVTVSDQGADRRDGSASLRRKQDYQTPPSVRCGHRCLPPIGNQTSVAMWPACEAGLSAGLRRSRSTRWSVNHRSLSTATTAGSNQADPLCSSTIAWHAATGWGCALSLDLASEGVQLGGNHLYPLALSGRLPRLEGWTCRGEPCS